MISKEELIKSLKERPYLVAHKLGYTGFTELHNEWLKKLIFDMENFTLQAHRGSYKTTCLIVAISLIILLKPTKTIGFFRKTDSDVKEVIRGVYKSLQSDFFNAMSVILYNYPIIFNIASTSEIDTNLNISNSGTPQLTGTGINGNLTGRHYDYIFTDDIITKHDRVYTAKREATKEAYLEILNLVNRGDDCFIKNIGTPWHKEDAFTLMPKPIKYDCYTTGLMSKEQIDKLKDTMPPSLFSANYELKHIADEDMLFFDPKFMKPDEFSLLDNGLCHIDASYGGEDYTAFTICRFYCGKFYVLGKLVHKHIDDCIQSFISLSNNYSSHKFYCEDNGDKGYLAKSIIQKYNKDVNTYHENMNKYLKITTYLYNYWDKVYFHPDTDEKYIEQILDYNTYAEHDDAPDSLSSIIRIFDKKIHRPSIIMTSAY